MSSVWGSVIGDALVEIGADGPIDPIPAEETALAVRYLNRILDQWTALARYAYATTFSTYTLVANLAPHTIGPTGTFVVATRPERIHSASLILTDVTPNVDVPIRVRPAAWWSTDRVKSLTSSIPTDLYYEKDWPNGSLYFWPVPTYAYGVRLEVEQVVTTIPVDANGTPQVNATFTAPPGYELAIVLTLAEALVTPYKRPMPPELPGKAQRARAAIVSANTQSPRISSADIGTGTKRRGGFNWLNGLPLE